MPAITPWEIELGKHLSTIIHNVYDSWFPHETHRRKIADSTINKSIDHSVTQIAMAIAKNMTPQGRVLTALDNEFIKEAISVTIRFVNSALREDHFDIKNQTQRDKIAQNIALSRGLSRGYDIISKPQNAIFSSEQVRKSFLTSVIQSSLLTLFEEKQKEDEKKKWW